MKVDTDENEESEEQGKTKTIAKDTYEQDSNGNIKYLSKMHKIIAENLLI